MNLDDMKMSVCDKLPELYEVVKDHPSQHQFVRHLVGEKGGMPVHWPTEGLQVCHEAEKLLDYEDWQLYIQKLQKVSLRDKNRGWITPHNHDTATYEQRLEALCRVWWPERFE